MISSGLFTAMILFTAMVALGFICVLAIVTNFDGQAEKAHNLRWSGMIKGEWPWSMYCGWASILCWALMLIYGVSD